jgi:hypothetical protein
LQFTQSESLMDLSMPAHMQVNTHPLHETSSALGYLKKYCNSLITKLENLSAISKYYTKVTV